MMNVKVNYFFLKKNVANLPADWESYLFSGFRAKTCEKWFYT